MDDEFFASVLKKWAYASQEVVDLKKRLGEVEKERNEYQHEITGLKARKGSRPAQRESSPVPSFSTLDLDEVENKLEEARIEYQRRLNELEDARSREGALGREVDDLKRQLKKLLYDSRIQPTGPSSELSNLRLEKETMAIKISDLSRKLQHAESARAELGTQDPGACEIEPQQVMNLQHQMTFLETQIHELQSLARGLEAENASLREELAATRESLQKTKEGNKSLMTTIGQLSRIARNVAGAPDQAPAGQQEPQPQGIATELQSPKASQVEPIAKEEQKLGTDLSFNDVTVVEEPNEPTTLISPRRLEALAALPVIILDNSINDDDNKFTRGFTSAGVASSIQSLLTRATSSDTDPPKKRHIEEYLCPRLDHNPWCPSTPGQHGYMLIASNKEKYIYATPKLRNLFVGLPKRSNKEERYFRYLGIYRVTRADPLSAEEWKHLPSTVKQIYPYTAKGKNKDPRTEEEIAAAYDSGEASIPCVKLECVDFDEELYAGLLAIRIKRPTTPKSRLVKRNQDGIYEGSVHSQRIKQSPKKLPK